MVKLSDKINNGEYVQLSAKVRADNSIPKENAVNVHFNVRLDGKTVDEILDVDMKVRFQSTLRNSFDSQQDLEMFVGKYATMDKPYDIHFDDLSKRIRTPEQKKAELLRSVSQLSADDKAELLKQLNG